MRGPASGAWSGSLLSCRPDRHVKALQQTSAMSICVEPERKSASVKLGSPGFFGVPLLDLCCDWSVRSDALLQPKGRSQTPATHTATDQCLHNQRSTLELTGKTVSVETFTMWKQSSRTRLLLYLHMHSAVPSSVSAGFKQGARRWTKESRWF